MATANLNNHASVTTPGINSAPAASVALSLPAIGRGGMLAIGIASVLGGTLAITLPVVASFAVAWTLAAILIAVGTLNFAAMFFAGKGHRWMHFLMGLFPTCLGVAMFAFPVANLLALTVLVAAMLMVEGGVRIGLALELKPVKGWGWVLTNGIVTAALALIIMFQLPGAGLWVIGMLVGVDLLFNGASEIAMALTAKKPEEAPAAG